MSKLARRAKRERYHKKHPERGQKTKELKVKSGHQSKFK